MVPVAWPLIKIKASFYTISKTIVYKFSILRGSFSIVLAQTGSGLASLLWVFQLLADRGLLWVTGVTIAHKYSNIEIPCTKSDSLVNAFKVLDHRIAGNCDIFNSFLICIRSDLNNYRAGSAVEALRRMIDSNDCFATVSDLWSVRQIGTNFISFNPGLGVNVFWQFSFWDFSAAFSPSIFK